MVLLHRDLSIMLAYKISTVSGKNEDFTRTYFDSVELSRRLTLQPVSHCRTRDKISVISLYQVYFPCFSSLP